MEYPYVNTLWTNETKCRSSQWAKFSKTVSSFKLRAKKTWLKNYLIVEKIVNMTFFF